MGKVEAAAFIVGIIMPLLVTLLKQSGLSQRVNLVIALIACAGAGVLTAYAAGLFTGTAVIVAIATVFSVASAEYGLFFRNTATEAKVNNATSIVK